MSLSSFLASLFPARAQNQAPAMHRAPRPRGGTRPCLEPLEDRTLLSAGAGPSSLAALFSPPAPALTGALAPCNSSGHQLAWQDTEAGVITSTDGTHFTFQARGHARHVGNITEVGSLVLDGSTLSGTATVTTANGDKIFLSISAHLDQTAGTATGQSIFVGGTGRFAGASGEVSWAAVFAPDRAHFTLSCSGAITLR